MLDLIARDALHAACQAIGLQKNDLDYLLDPLDMPIGDRFRGKILHFMEDVHVLSTLLSLPMDIVVSHYAYIGPFSSSYMSTIRYHKKINGEEASREDSSLLTLTIATGPFLQVSNK